jgi:Cu2+-containing amine oxidase
MRRFSLGLIVVIFSGFLFGGQDEPKKQPAPKKAVNEIIQEFPSNDVAKTAWKVHWATSNGFGLTIQDAYFKKSANEPWMQVLGDCRLSEMFVPYHSSSPRFWDVSYNFSLCSVGPNDAGPFGKVLNNPPTVVQEVRDRGLMWIGGGRGSRRGQMLVLWATLNAANYRYVVEYGFKDDGGVQFRVGSSGRNYGSREFEGHMHNGLWRVDVNLDGPDHNTVTVMDHIEPDGEHKGKAKTVHRLFNDGKEGFEDWKADQFTMLNVAHTKKRNARKQPISYDVMPLRHGNARHYGDGEKCTEHDFWVTKNRPGEIYYVRLPEYVKKGEAITDTDVVVWVSTPGHHEPRSEDGEFKGGSFDGATPLMWCGFDLKPRNLWDRSPFYP